MSKVNHVKPSASSAIRYVITPDSLAHVTLLPSRTRFVVQADFFRKLLDLHPRTVLGSTTVDAVQLAALTGVPIKEVTADDARTCLLVV
ncbi:hypothetical protein M6D81_13940 [Paenibacillus sp. J5C_2022]|uniref:hypothetical protein n=1 Tax=Paenibacillus sp. J5C2022 TaxID=2977129 RepID=UPI0021CE1783|nr:hypothetical protein [Paenibacillus sp. J5C2022]MCU6709794.1 hypothetical protein [Paenibacillus sp. J5C2022]